MYSVLPPSVANELRHHRPVPARKYDEVTIMFSGIVGFSQFCAQNSSEREAIKVVKLLNDLYTRFDEFIDYKKNPNVYKVSENNFRYTFTLYELIPTGARHRMNSYSSTAPAY